MPTVTDITAQQKKKDRYNIYLDDEYAGSLNAEEMVLSGIKIGLAISLEAFSEILRRDNEKYAFNQAIKYISLKRRTVFETRTHLLDKNLDEAIVDSAIQKVLDYGYLNDSDYAKEFVAYYINAEKYGRLTVAYKLKTKGIDEDTIEQAMSAFSEELETAIAKKQAEKLKKTTIGLSPYERKGKISRALSAKGFGYDIISAMFSSEDDE